MATPFGQMPMIPPMPLAGGGAGMFQDPMMGLPPAMGGAQPGFSTLDLTQFAPPPLPAQPEESAIEKLGPGTDLHAEVIKRLNAYWKYSEDKISARSHHWNYQELRIQAYISQPDYKQLIRELDNNRGLAPEPVQVIVPYSYATLHAAATFLASVLIGRRPIFPLMATRGTTVDKARYMEQAIQSNIEACRGYEQLWQFIWDSLIYSFGSMRIGWSEQWGKSLRIIGGQREVVDGLKYAGNKLYTIDPYAFRPDPRVPIWEASRKGDFVMWHTPQSKLILKDMEKDGLLKWVDAATDRSKLTDLGPNELPPVADSRRRARIGADGSWHPAPHDIIGFNLVREGTVRLVAKDWKLGEGDRSELWKFSWTPSQIMQAEPLGMAHERHPVTTCEPTSLGHDFGSLSLADFIGPFQDIISWLVNSRMENVRTTINNQFLVDPARVEMQDLRQPAPGRAIRLKRSAVGTDVREAFMQLQVMDTTGGHIGDIQTLRLLADTITGVNDNMRGIQTQGGRRSATEARMSMQAGASRLSQMAVRISSQGFTELTEQMIMNIQQFMPNEMWVEMTGDDGMPTSSLMTPDMIVGSFNYQISDGSLPYDKMALLEVWQQILMGAMQDPELRQAKDVVKIFDYVATLGGAKNISAFSRQQQPMLPSPQQAAMDPNLQAVGAALPAPPAQLQIPFGGGR